MYVVEVLLLVCTYIVCIVHMYVLLISGKTAQLKSLLANFFSLVETVNQNLRLTNGRFTSIYINGGSDGHFEVLNRSESQLV